MNLSHRMGGVNEKSRHWGNESGSGTGPVS